VAQLKTSGPVFPDWDVARGYGFIQYWELRGSRQHGYIGICPHCRTERRFTPPAIDTRPRPIADIEYIKCPCCAWRFYPAEESNQFRETLEETKRKAAREAEQARKQHEPERLADQKVGAERERQERIRDITHLVYLAAKAQHSDDLELWDRFRYRVYDSWAPSLVEFRDLFDPGIWHLVEHEGAEHWRKRSQKLHDQEAKDVQRRVLARKLPALIARVTAAPSCERTYDDDGHDARDNLREAVFTICDGHGLRGCQDLIDPHMWGRVVDVIAEWADIPYPPVKSQIFCKSAPG